MLRQVQVFSLLVLTGCLSACGGGASDMPEVGTVTGTVTLDGNPVAGATVSFWPKEGGRTSTGVTDENGRYELEYMPGVKGAKIGRCQVSVSTMREAEYDESGENIIREATEETIPSDYNDDTSLEQDVKAGDNQINLDLTT